MLMSKHYIVALLPFVAIGPGVFEGQELGGVCVCASFLVLLCQVVGSRSFLSSAEGRSTASSP